MSAEPLANTTGRSCSPKSSSSILQTSFRPQRPFYVNLLDDLGAGDFFVIDGDALLLDSLCCVCRDSRHGLQMLQLFYLVESFLDSLRNCLNSKFCFVFFKHHKKFWHQSPSYSLARHVLQQHLKYALGQIVHTDFPSWHSQEWLQYVDQERPAFLLVTDLASVCKEALPESNLGMIRQVMQACIMYSLTVRLPIAFLAELRVQQDMAFGFKLTEARGVRDVDACCQAARQVGEDMLQQMSCLDHELSHDSPEVPPWQPSTAAWHSARETGALQHLGWVSCAGAWSCACLLKSSLPPALWHDAFHASDKTPTLLFCKAWCLHEASKLHLSLEQRCLNLEQLEKALHAEDVASAAKSKISADPITQRCRAAKKHSSVLDQLQTFITVWSTSFQKHLVEATAASTLREADQVQLLDAVDGRLWHFMTCCLLTAAPVGLPACVLQTAQQLMQAVCHLADFPADSIPLSTARQHQVSNNTQSQQEEAEGPDTSSSLGCRHSVRGNVFVDAFLGTQAASEVCDGMAAGDELALFDEAYHWHTGRPLEPTYLGETGEDRIIAQWKSATLFEMARCPWLSLGRRNQLKNIISMCQDVKLVPKAEERQERLKSALRASQNWLETNLRKRDQRQATFMRNYADSIMSTAYQGPSTAAALVKGSHCTRSTSKAPKPVKLSKADIIRQQQTEKRAAKGAVRQTDKWTTKQQELDRALQVSGWNSRLQSEVGRFLSECKQGAPAAYLSASVFLLEQSLNAWKAACQSRRRRAASASPSAAAAGAASVAASAAAEPGSVTADGIPHAVTIWMTVQELVCGGRLDTASCALPNKELAKKAGKLCEQAMQVLGFTQAAARISSLLATSKSSKTPKQARQTGEVASVGSTGATAVASSGASGSSGSQRDFVVGMTEAHFQLQHCGNLLQRDAPAVRDPRVVSFNPDLWQRSVLDVIDADASAVVCAPTSSGKTFISSYCMDRVLRQSKDGIVVFVAPTKALVNQTAAQVLKDFSKGGSDKSVYGVFTRDYRINALEARILVTVPACLEILLFSPAHRDWVSRLRYVIFDEVHCMREGGIKEGGAAESTGTIWEHCLLLIRCPFLALSATIGNPEQVTEWLQSVKALQQQQDTKLGIAGPSQMYKVNLIQHAERYADLRYYSFKPAAAQQDDDCPNTTSTAAPASQGSQDVFKKIHPCAVLTAAQLQDSSFPSELSLEPCDCLELANAMHDVLQTVLLPGSSILHAPATRSMCELTNAAGMHTVVKQGSAIAMAPGSTMQAAEASSAAACTDQVDQGRTAAQSALHVLSADMYFPDGKPISRSTVRVWEKALKQELVLWATVHGSVGLQATAQVLAQLKEGSAWDPRTTFTNESYNPLQFHRLIRALDRQNMLPVLTFSFERRKCERLAEGLVDLLESEEARRKEASEGDHRKQEAAAERARKAVKASRDKKTGRKAAEDALQEDASGLMDVEEDSIDPDFSFAGRVRTLSPQELRELIEQATYGMEADHPLKRALLRGIGVHHSGLPTKYRQVVEILFRCSYLRVVIATGTLAYGINMPCRTVVFAGDHIFLNSLQFRQMTGRAGRRGFGTLGHVIFWAVPSRKCTSLLVSPVPRLHGNFPLSVSLSLRALTLHSAAPEDAQLQNDLLRLLQRPFYACEDAQLQQKMQHLFQFSLHYLTLQNALNAQGRPVQLAGMAMHLFWAEPANFAFVTLLRKGIFHNICAGSKLSAAGPLPDRVASEILLVLSHVFERVQLAPFVCADTATIHASPSKVILEPLGSEVGQLLADHNQEAVDNLVAYIKAYIASNADALPPSNIMPLSGFTYPPSAIHSVLPDRRVSSDLASGELPSSGVQRGDPTGGHQRADSPTGGQGLDTSGGVGGGEASGGGQRLDHPMAYVTGLGALQAYSKKHYASSPFVSLSGYDEAFSSTQQLLQCVRPGILLDAASVPSVQMTNRNGQKLPLNRYILDYWGHGQKQALVHANGLREGDAWERLRTFAGILRAIATAMEKMVEGTTAESDPVVHSFTKLAEGFTDKHKAFNSARQLQRG